MTTKQLLRVRFKANPDDPRPVNWPVEHPYWVSGQGGGYSIVISYAYSKDYILKNWPEAEDLDIENVDNYAFSDRFPEPEWHKNKKQPEKTEDGTA